MTRHSKGIITNKPIVLDRFDSITYRVNETDKIELFDDGNRDLVIHAEKTYSSTILGLRYKRAVEFVIDTIEDLGFIIVSQDGYLEHRENSKDFTKVLKLLRQEHFDNKTVKLFKVLYQKYLSGQILFGYEVQL